MVGHGPSGGAGKASRRGRGSLCLVFSCMCAVLRGSVLSDSLQPQGLYVACQAPLSVGILQAGTLKETKAEAPQMGGNSSEANCDIQRAFWPPNIPQLNAGNSVYGIRIIPDLTSLMCQLLSHVGLSVTPWTLVHQGILEARILEWVAIPFYRGSSWLRDQNPSLLHYRRILYCLSHWGSFKSCGTHFFVQVEKKGPGRTQTASILILEKF